MPWDLSQALIAETTPLKGRQSGTLPHTRQRGRRQEHRCTEIMGDLSVSLVRKWPRGVARRRGDY